MEMAKSLPTVEDCVRLVHDKGILKGWRDKDIIQNILRSIQECCFVYDIHPVTGKLCSICFGYWTTEHSCHIVGVAGERGCLLEFIKYLNVHFPNIKLLTAYRDGKPVSYQVDNLYGKLQSTEAS